ncbi:hypothetical protein [Nitrospira sp. BLG_2]|uniref:hypothetical protein n=1 Tax=Nitrospira sp. BLG_2 TaxID=3397507 RepID=UPI003B9A006B
MNSRKDLRNWCYEHTNNWSDNDIEQLTDAIQSHPDRPQWSQDWTAFLNSLPALEAVVELQQELNETLFFTVINPDNVEQEERIEIECKKAEKTFVINGLAIDHQQLAELGTLLLALACKAESPDIDSCAELLDGFNLPIPTKALKELANNGNG